MSEKNTIKIFQLPNYWLTKKEREFLFEKLFSAKDQKTLHQFAAHNQKFFSAAKAIVVDLIKPPGCLGDTIRDSRLTGVLNLHYPDKTIFEWSHQPDLLGKYRFIKRIQKNKEKFFLSYQENQNSPEKKAVFNKNEVIKVSSLFNGELPAAFIEGDYRQGFNFKNLPLHHNHRQQIVWEIIYNIDNLAFLPDPSVEISREDKIKAKEIFGKATGNKKSLLNIVIHPDAHQNHFEEKKWPVEKWVGLIEKIEKSLPQTQIFINTGVNHPNASQEIHKKCLEKNLSTLLLPALPLAQYAGLLMNFPKSKTIFLGLESMAGSHLIPGLGLKSVVIGASKLFDPSIFGPFAGIVVQNNQKKAQSITEESVFQAIKMSINNLTKEG